MERTVLLRPGGGGATPSMDANPHHLHDFSARSFRKLLARHDLIGQPGTASDVQPFGGQ